MNNKNQTLQVQGTTAISPIDQATQLISQAIDKNVPVETMEKLLGMRRELKAEFAKEEYDKAFAKLQAQIPVIEKKKVAGTGNFTYNYAPLEDIIEKVKDPIAYNGFSYTFDTEQNEKVMKIFCKVKHAAGHTETSVFQIGIDTSARMNSTQQYGATLTYGKRYTFCNAFGIVVGGEDTDATTVKVVKQEPVEELPKDLIGTINLARTQEDLILACKVIKAKIKPQLQKVLVAEYTRRKNEIVKAESEQVAEDVAEALDEEPAAIMTEPK